MKNLLLIFALTAVAAAQPTVTTPSGLRYQILQEGSGPAARPRHLVSVHFKGWLANGTRIDAGLAPADPFQFELGTRQVIAGWDEGIQGMHVGEKRRLTIPATLGYGDRGVGEIIPPDSILIFDVELLKIQRPGD